ncbi:unnamed protein product [Rotaria sp. Silwood2]|nr:unnamed protein product [Rotaria sp. Silwood2]
MAERKERHAIQTCRNNDPSTDINILLLGQTGVGKSTFINGLVNYLCNDTVEDAIRDQMQFVIPSAFTYIDDDTFEEITIRIGERNEHENFDENDHSCTQQCRSFLFPIGEKNLRIIDTPGIRDTRGLEQDTKNFHEILTYISQYEHLNGVCILLKPNEERLTILSNFVYQKSWDHTVEQYSRLMAFIVTCPLHAVCNILSLNEAEQLIRKLTRPIVETTRLIEQNLQLAKEYAKDISENPELAHQGLPQKNATSDHLRYPTTICTNRKCCRTVIVNNEIKIEPLSKYHEICYLTGVTQESYNDERIADCEIMHYETGLEHLMEEYKEEINLFKETIKNEKDPTNYKDVVKTDEIFTLVGTLYRLPIYGNFIRTQVNGLQISQDNISSKREVYVELSAKANTSKIMHQFRNHISLK